MSDEDDYMSDAFLQGSDVQDIRPGLIKDRSIQRQINLSKKRQAADVENKNRHLSIKTLAKQSLEDGLQKPLDSDNKGYEMMTKMGFQPGKGLGKTGEGRSDPIPVEVKTNREGLGVRAALNEILAEKAKKWMEAKANAPTVTDYRARMIEEANERQAGIDLFKSQKACLSLDTAQGLSEPIEEWFWPPQKISKEEDDTESEEEEPEEEEIPLSPPDKLEMLTLYLRRTYYYCMWCGTKFEDEKDMQQECPGPTRTDH